MSDPSIPKSKSYACRLNTYDEWPENLKQTPDAMASAGFKYTHQRDKVVCEACGGKLYNWRENDDPVIEHLRYFPDCDFLKRLFEEENERGSGEKGKGKPESKSSTESSAGPEHHTELHPHHHHYHVPDGTDRKWLRRQMDTPRTQILLKKGYPRDDIKEVIVEHFETTHHEYEDAVSILRSIYALEDREHRPETSAHQAVLHMSDNLDMCTCEPATASADLASTQGDNMVGSPREAPVSPRPDPRNIMEPPTPKPETEPTTTPGNKTTKTSDKSLCVLCRQEEMGALFMPCGHLCVCPDCAVKINQCPTCNKDIMHRLRVYVG